MSIDAGYYNFLPPFLQANGSGDPVAQQKDIERLNQYIPQYNTTVGYLTPLEVDGSGVPTNLVGMSGPAGSTGGLSYSPPATPFMMVAYGQTSNNGIMQFSLMNGDVLPSLGPTPRDNIFLAYTADPTQYFFMPTSDVIDLSRVTQVFYRQFGSNTYKFYDANLIRQNPTQPVYNYELFAQCQDFDSDVNFSSWPMQYNLFPTGGFPGSLLIRFQQNYLSTETNLGAGAFYNIHDINIVSILDGPPLGSPYGDYNSSNDFTGYGPGYPVNFNYGYTNSNKAINPNNNTDSIIADNGDKWPAKVSLNVYNSNISKVENYFYSGNTGILTIDDNGNTGINTIQNITNLIQFLGNGYSFLKTGSTCSTNNQCSNDTDTYFDNNFNSTQAGIMQYLIYQFIPFQQLKTPINSIVTDFRNTEYSYVTLPQGIEFTPQGYKINNFGQAGPTGPFGSFPVEIQNLIDGATGATGFTTSRSSIISGWMNNPFNTLYNCTASNAVNSYCGFLEYYDSLFGIPYEYTNGCTGPNKGPCPSGEYCVPNFEYLTTYNSDVFNQFMCVTAQEGVTTQNLEYYIGSLPANTQNINNITFPPYEPANPGPAPPKNANQPSTQASNLFFYIGIAVAVIVLIVVIWLIVKVARDKPEYKSYTRVFPQEPNLNPLNINAL